MEFASQHFRLYLTYISSIPVHIRKCFAKMDTTPSYAVLNVTGKLPSNAGRKMDYLLFKYQGTVEIQTKIQSILEVLRV